MENNEEYQKWLDEVSHMGWKLRDVPDEFKTYDLCWEAVSDYGNALEYVPKELIDSQICIRAVDNGLSLQYVPEEFITQSMCETSVGYDGLNLEAVPEKFINEKMCLYAVKDNEQRRVSFEI